MTPEDYEFAVNLTDRMNWGMTRQDFEFMRELEPEGCFVLLQDEEKVGVATAISFDGVGWFGNLIVSERCRKRGAGSTLVEHALEYLKTRAVQTVGLYAYMERIPFYKRLGFKYDSKFQVLKGKGFSCPREPGVRRAEERDMQGIVELDRHCFGASRRRLLEPIILDSDNFRGVFVEDRQLLGFVVAKVYGRRAELGPLVCSEGRGDVSVKLLKAALNRLRDLEVSMCVSERAGLVVDLLTESEFTVSFEVARMFWGAPVVSDCACVAESLERG
jgi:predicted N-acetyltransferase YhbS